VLCGLDLGDEGADHFAQTIRAIRREIPYAEVEVLTPDFHAREELIRVVTEASPEVFNHNLETVERLQEEVRVQGRYDRSLKTLALAKKGCPEIVTKSGLMLGLGERDEEILQTAKDMLASGVNILTLGQYLRPSAEHLEVKEYVHPDKFKEWTFRLEALGFDKVFAGPYVRSSYHAGETYLKAHQSA